MHIAYIPNIEGKQIVLSEEESKHCIRVLRMEMGSKLELIDGKGGSFTGQISLAHQKKCEVQIIEESRIEKRSNYHLHIAIAPTKNMDRLEWFLEKCTEIGIDEISLIKCDHSERKVIKDQRLEKIIVSAMKQSKTAFLPKLNSLETFESFITKQTAKHKFIAHCEETTKKGLKEIYSKGEDIVILIGPEGDFSSNEITMAKANNFKELALGETRLRTETAGVVACHSVVFMNE